MSKIYLDANFFIDILDRDKKKAEQLSKQEVFTSTLSYHIFSYTQKVQMPSQPLLASLGTISTIPYDNNILQKSLNGPTTDEEDNVHLHSAAQENCDYFLTNDKKLLKMKFFGKTEIINKLNQ